MQNFSNDLILPEWPAPKNIQAFMTTRNTIRENLALPAELILLTQMHGADVVMADELEVGKETKADAVYTQTPHKLCVVKTADCLPILVCDKKGSVVAAIHAGWKGLVAGVIEATLKKLSVPSEDLLVWLGAAIGPSRFEVGEDVKEKFPNDLIAFRPISQTKYLCDIYQIARRHLENLNVKNIYGGTECTYSHREKFYSHRQKESGRMLSLIWISD